MVHSMYITLNEVNSNKMLSEDDTTAAVSSSSHAYSTLITSRCV
jgi:hypothetical protein